MAKTERPLDKRMADFVKFHLADKHAFAPFTGSDFSAWKAFLYGLELYGRGDYNRQENALRIMQACTRAAQAEEDVLAIFKKSIPGVLDWGFEAKLWALVHPRKHAGDLTWACPCPDGERICSHLHSKPSTKHAGYFKCKDCGGEWKLTEDSKPKPVLENDPGFGIFK